MDQQPAELRAAIDKGLVAQRAFDQAEDSYAEARYAAYSALGSDDGDPYAEAQKAYGSCRYAHSAPMTCATHESPGPGYGIRCEFMGEIYRLLDPSYQWGP